MLFGIDRLTDALLSPLLLAWMLVIVALGAQLANQRRAALIATIGSAVVLWLAGNTAVGYCVAHALEMEYVPSSELPAADAIVVLAGITRKAYPPQPVPHLSSGADRLTYAALLYQQHKAPLIIFSGNSAESAEMAAVMEMLGVPRAALVGEHSRAYNTYGAARDLEHTFECYRVRKILLVTSAIRMPRAVAVFRSLGIRVTPAPTDFMTRTVLPRMDPVGAMVPYGNGECWNAAVHEMVGLVGYHLAGWL